MRVANPERKVKLEVKSGENVILTKMLPVAKPSEMIAVDIQAEKTALIGETLVTGNTCPRCPKYAHDDVVAPKRMLTSTVQVKGGLLPLLPVVSKTTLPKERILDCAAALRQIAVKAPVTEGQIIVENILGLGVDIIASRSMEAHRE